MSTIEYESEFEVYAVDDESTDFCFRVHKLVKTLNVIQLKSMTRIINGIKCIPLGTIANTINIHSFMDQCKKLNIHVELDLERKKQTD